MYLCLACSKEFDPADPRISDESHPNYRGCPECGDKGISADTNARLTISITWHELRILCMWAEFWVGAIEPKDRGSMMKVVYGIADRIQMQHLDQKTGLTFRSELADLSAAGFTYEQNIIPEDQEGK